MHKNDAPLLLPRFFFPLSPDNSLLENARRFHQNGNYAEAKRVYTDFLKDCPNHPDVLHLMSLAAFQDGDVQTGMDHICRAIEIQPMKGEFHLSLGGMLSASGDIESAVVCFRKATVLNPSFPDAYLSLAVALSKQGYLESALHYIEEALALTPSHTLGLFQKAALLRKSGRAEEAANSLRQALKLAPNRPEFYTALGSLYLNQGWFDRAENYYRRALEIEPDFPDGQIGLGQVALLKKPAQADAGNGRFDRTLQIQPGFTPGIIGKLILLMQREKAEEVQKSTRALIETGDHRDEIAALYVRASIKCGKTDSAVDFMNTAIAKTDGRFALNLHLHLGCLHDLNGAYDSAFKYFGRGRPLKESIDPHEAWEHRIDQLMEVYAPEKMHRMPKAVNRSQIPVFIVGLPHSGKFFIEYLFSTHPEVFSIGHLSLTSSMVQNLKQLPGITRPFPEGQNELTSRILDGLSQTYLRHIKGFTKAKRCVDTSPFNFLYLGFIARLFPKSTIIYCRRDPRDLALSMHVCPSSAGFPSFSHTDLGQFTSFYRQFQRLMNHWKSALEIQIITIDFEEMQNNPETVCRRIFQETGFDAAGDLPPKKLEFSLAVQFYRLNRIWGFDAYLPANHWTHYRRKLEAYAPLFE